MKSAMLGVFGAALLMAASIGSLHPEDLTVHEWGTFTSIAGDDGMAIDWEPLDGPSDLPCFVHRFEARGEGALVGDSPYGNSRDLPLWPRGEHGQRSSQFSEGFYHRMVPQGEAGGDVHRIWRSA